MKVRVKYYGVAREASGKREETVELNDGSSVMNLVRYLVEVYGEPLLGYIFDEDEQILDYLMFSVNNVDVMSLEKFETVLFDADVIFVLPPIGGGLILGCVKCLFYY